MKKQTLSESIIIYDTKKLKLYSGIMPLPGGVNVLLATGGRFVYSSECGDKEYGRGVMVCPSSFGMDWLKIKKDFRGYVICIPHKVVAAMEDQYLSDSLSSASEIPFAPLQNDAARTFKSMVLLIKAAIKAKDTEYRDGEVTALCQALVQACCHLCM